VPLCRAQRNYTLLLSRGTRRAKYFKVNRMSHADFLLLFYVGSFRNDIFELGILYKLYNLTKFLLLKLYSFITEMQILVECGIIDFSIPEFAFIKGNDSSVLAHFITSLDLRF